MAQLIKNNSAATDSWTVLELSEGETPEAVALPAGDIIFPLAVWQARKTEIISCHKRIGLLLQTLGLLPEAARMVKLSLTLPLGHWLGVNLGKCRPGQQGNQ